MFLRTKCSWATERHPDWPFLVKFFWSEHPNDQITGSYSSHWAFCSCNPIPAIVPTFWPFNQNFVLFSLSWLWLDLVDCWQPNMEQIACSPSITRSQLLILFQSIFDPMHGQGFLPSVCCCVLFDFLKPPAIVPSYYRGCLDRHSQ